MGKEKVQKVLDGDTFTTKDGDTIRLAGVNCPEKGKKGAPQARKDLVQLVSRKTVTVMTKARDKYGRVVADVKVAGRSVNKAMRQKGWK